MKILSIRKRISSIFNIFPVFFSLLVEQSEIYERLKNLQISKFWRNSEKCSNKSEIWKSLTNSGKIWNFQILKKSLKFWNKSENLKNIEILWNSLWESEIDFFLPTSKFHSYSIGWGINFWRSSVDHLMN